MRMRQFFSSLYRTTKTFVNYIRLLCLFLCIYIYMTDLVVDCVFVWYRWECAARCKSFKWKKGCLWQWVKTNTIKTTKYSRIHMPNKMFHMTTSNTIVRHSCVCVCVYVADRYGLYSAINDLQFYFLYFIFPLHLAIKPVCTDQSRSLSKLTILF